MVDKAQLFYIRQGETIEELFIVKICSVFPNKKCSTLALFIIKEFLYSLSEHHLS